MNRMEVLFSALSEQTKPLALADIIFRETTAFGLRVDEITRLKLERRFEKVTTEFGEVTVKLGLKGSTVVQVAPEFESCRAVSESSGAALRTVYEASVA